MKAVKYASIVIIAAVLGALILRHVTIEYIPVGHVGVRTQQYAIFGKKGVIEKDFDPGWHRNLGPIDSWEIFDSTVQTLEMTRDPNRGDRKGRDDVRVQSADGYEVSVDMTIKFRIMEGMAHEVLKNTGRGTKYREIVRNEAERAFVDIFGQMETEDFYNPKERRSKGTEAKTRLAESLKDNFIEVIDVLIRDVQFDPQYEEKIRKKKLADQDVELNKSLNAAAQMRGKTQVIEAETIKLVKIITEEKQAEIETRQAATNEQIAEIRANYEKYATVRRAEADLIAAKAEAEGQLLVKKAEAKGEKLRNEAMQGVGGSTIVALEAAKNLNLDDVTISTMNIDLLDIDGMATRLGVTE